MAEKYKGFVVSMARVFGVVVAVGFIAVPWFKAQAASLTPSVLKASVKLRMSATVRMAIADANQSSVATNLGIYGGNNWDIAVDGDHVYTIASGVPNGFFYSSDAAATWQRPAGAYDYGSGTAVEVDTVNHVVYVALEGLYKSSDYGVTLTKIADNVGNPLLYTTGLLIGTYNDVAYISTDGGVTFTPVTIASGENIMSYAASPTAGTIYAVTRNDGTGVTKLYKSLDYGLTWTALAVDASVTSFTGVAVKPTDASFITLSGDNYLWRSMDGGLTWTSINTLAGRPCSNYSIWTSTRWYACSGYSTDDGVTWTNMDGRTNVMRGPGKTVTFDAATPTVMYGDCMSGVCKSTDGGLTWRNSLDGITGVNVLAISVTTDKKTAWIASTNGLGKTENFDSTTPTWTWPILPCDLATRCDSSGIGESVWVKPNNPDIVLAGSIGGWVYRSTDAGTTWTGQIPAVVDVAKFKTGSWNNLRPYNFINDPTDSNIVYLALVDPVDHIGAVLKSIDAGITWTDLAITGDAPATVLAMSSTGVLYAGTGEGKQITTTKGIFKYEGGVWTALTGIDARLNINSVVVDPETPTTVYATASNDLAPLQLDGFFRSTDSGATWTQIVPAGYLGFGAITLQRNTSPNTLYMAARDNANHGVLLKSSDQGLTWGVLYVGLKSESFSSVLFDALVAGTKRGFFALKSRATFYKIKASATTVKKANNQVTLTGVLRDQATRKLLKNQTVGLYQLSGKKWKLIRVLKTDKKKATISVSFKPSKSGKYRLTWTPNKTNRIEYAVLNSKTFSITVKK